MKNGYYGSLGGEAPNWFVVQVITVGNVDYACVGEESRAVDQLFGKFVHIEPPKG